MLSAVVTPWDRSVSSTFPPCSLSLAKLKKPDPLNWLPPSFGMMFTRTPPPAPSRRYRADLVRDSLRRLFVGRQSRPGVVPPNVGFHQPIELHDAIVERPAVRLELFLVLARRSADVVLIAAHADGHHP